MKEKSQIFFTRIALFIALFHLLSAPLTGKAQEEIDFGFAIPTFISPSPTVSALGDYLNHPVDYYTGIPQIDIPLFNLSFRSISLPIQLSYHASGIRVDQMASWVGLGWSLKTGGCISRTVRGGPDDQVFWYDGDVCGYLDRGQLIVSMYNGNLSEIELLHIAGGVCGDAVPDLFNYQFGSTSGSFMFDENGTIRLVPENDLKISYTRNSSTHRIDEFIITTTDGTKYIFNTIEETTFVSQNWSDFFSPYDLWQYNFLKVILDDPIAWRPLYRTQKEPFTSSWHLSKIILQGLSNEIVFTYRDEKQLIRAMSDETEHELMINPPQRTQSATAIFIDAKLPQEITWPDGRIAFNTSLQSRLDNEKIPSYNYNNYSLGQINIYDKNEKLIKGFGMHFSYFLSEEPDFGSQYAEQEAQFAKRLRLDSLVEFIYDQANSYPVFMPPYKFLYNELALPHRASAQRDFWGYYNANMASNLLPSCYEYPIDLINDTTFFPSHFSIYQRPFGTYTGNEIFHSGANRNTDTNYCKAGILNHIVFPTGGGIKYVYESHEFFIQGTKLIGSGLRIKKKILSPDNSYPNEQNIITEYDYCNSGKIIDLPQYYSYQGAMGDVVKHSQWDSRNALSKGGYVTYSKVKEIVNGNGYTEYSYLQPATFGTIYEDLDQSANEFIYVRPKIFGYGPFSYLANEYDYYPKPYNPNYDWKRGLLSSKSVFNQFGDTLTNSKYEYQIKKYKKIPQIEAKKIISTEGVGVTFKVSQNYSISPWIVKTKETEKYFGGNITMTNETNFEYTASTHHQTTSKTEVNSDGRSFSERYKYIVDIDFSPLTAGCTSTYLNCKQTARVTCDACLLGCQSLPTLEERTLCKLNCYYDYDSDTSICRSEYNTCLDGINLPAKTRVIFNMQRKHMIGLPLESQKLVDNKAVGGKIFEYSTFPGGVGGELYKPKIELSLNTSSPIANCQQIHLDSQNNLVYNSQYAPQLNFDSYSTKGNPLELYKESDVHTAYIWGYNDTYPVIKAENVSFSVLNDAVNAATGSLLNLLIEIGDMTTELQKTAWKTFNTNLRTYSGLSNAMVTTYTYKPLVGLTSTTDPNGISTYYEYDAFGRLIIVRDNGDLGGNIVKHYDYHYTIPTK